MKKILSLAGVALLSAGAFAQTNLQLFYDFGENREHITSTLEMFKSDNWGNTFFFVDYDYNWKNADKDVIAPSNTYFEIARCFNFWGDTGLAPLSLQVEYNGGFGTFGNGLGCFPVNNAWLFGVDFFMHSDDFANTLNLKVLYKNIAEAEDNTPIQFTAVWGMNNIFGIDGLNFSGFADVWGQKGYYENKDGKINETDWVFISEPQLWYNVGKLFGCDNLNIGGEIEISNNFTQEGFMCNPCLGVKWAF